MSEFLNPDVAEDREIIKLRLECLNIATHMIGPEPFDSELQSIDTYLNKYSYLANHIAQILTHYPTETKDDGHILKFPDR